MDDKERLWHSQVIPLKFTWQATANELLRLKELIETRTSREEDSLRPSMIIDGFLYHGDWKQASNKALLDELDVRCLINVSDLKLNEEIVEERHVLWINVEDDNYTDMAQYFPVANQFLQSCRAKGKKVLVHCQLGVSRSSTIVLSYLIK